MSACLKKEALLALLDGELAPGEMASLHGHIAGCLSCRLELDSIRATNLKVNALLGSLAPNDAASAGQISVIRISGKAANPGVCWVAVASVGVLVAALALFVLIWRTHTVTPSDIAKIAAPSPVNAVEKKDLVAPVASKLAHVVTPKLHAKVRKFQALDNGAPIETGMIYRVSLPSSTSPDASATQTAKRIPAEVIVDEFGKVRAIRFLQ